MRYSMVFCLQLIYVSLFAQPAEIRKVQSAIITTLVVKDSANLKNYVDDNFILVHADGLVQGKKEFIHSYDAYGPNEGLSVMLIPAGEKVSGDVIIVRGIAQSQWLEGDFLLRSKIPYTDTYHNVNGRWLLLSSFINDMGENYYALGDTTGVRAAIIERYRLFDKSVMEKNLAAHLSLKTNDFSSIDQAGNAGSPKLVRERSVRLFDEMKDQIRIISKAESFEFMEDTVKVIVLQTFNRNQLIAGKTRHIESSIRERDNWLLTKEGWKLVLVDNIRPISRIVDGMPTDPSRPFDPKAPAYKPR